MIKKQKGQGLAETAVTLLIIVGSVLALIQFQNMLSYSNDVAQQQNTALNLANNKIETLSDFSTIAGYNALTSGSSTTTLTSATYTIAWTVTPIASPSYSTIDVTVSWTDRHNVAQSVRLTNIVAGIDPQFSSSIM